MIGFFPDPLPDELLYSVCARLADRVQYRSHSSVVRELFGTRNAAAVVDLPSRLGHLMAALPSGHQYTVDRLIDDHTLLPFYSPFCPSERINQVREDMQGANGACVYGRLGILVSQKAQWLQFCPLCAEDDILAFGECYWHRLHQVPGVKVCPVHAVFLEPSNVPFRHGRKPFELISAQTTIPVSSCRFLDSSNPHHKALLKIARDAAWLLNQRHLSLELEDLPGCYLRLLADCGLANYEGNVRAKKLNRAFQDFYTKEFLQQLKCKIDTDSYNHWLLRLTRFSVNKVQFPLHHLLLIQFLGYTVAEFFQLQRVLHARAPMKLRPENTKEVASHTLETYRQKWLEARATYPEAGRTLLRTKFGGIHIWLNRHDPEWLEAHLPPRLSRSKVTHQQSRRVDWSSRDAQLVTAVRDSAFRLKNAAGRPIWITQTAIGRDIGQHTLIQKQIDKLPLTAKVLADVVETHLEYAIRRLQWATECFRQENVYPKRWQLLLRASLKPDTVALPSVKEAISAALASLEPLRTD